MGFFEQLSYEVSNMDLGNFIVIFLFFYIPFLFSKKADAEFLRVIFSVIGIYMLLTMHDPRVLYDLKMLVGLGLVLPQIRFIIYFVKSIIETIKMASVNTFYFFLTIYYKIVRFINWIKSSYETIQIFFSNLGSKKEQTYSQDQKTYENKDDYSSYERHEEKSQERSYSYEQKEDKQKESYSYNENSNNSYKEQRQTYQEEPKQETKDERNGFEQYFSQSAYTVLGVNVDDDFKTIKKIYRKLAREFHPDLHPNEFDFYNEIMGNINIAYAKLEKIHN